MILKNCMVPYYSKTGIYQNNKFIGLSMKTNDALGDSIDNRGCSNKIQMRPNTFSYVPICMDC